jgi:hypothetical protein
MKHLRIYEDYQMETMPTEMITKGTGFETESSEIRSVEGPEASYVINFTNSEGEQTTIETGEPNSPKIIGDSMISPMEMIPGSSSDGKKYSVTGYYNAVPDGHGAYSIDQVLIKEI